MGDIGDTPMFRRFPALLPKVTFSLTQMRNRQCLCRLSPMSPINRFWEDGRGGVRW